LCVHVGKGTVMCGLRYTMGLSCLNRACGRQGNKKGGQVRCFQGRWRRWGTWPDLRCMGLSCLNSACREQGRKIGGKQKCEGSRWETEVCFKAGCRASGCVCEYDWVCCAGVAHVVTAVFTCWHQVFQLTRSASCSSKYSVSFSLLSSSR
jgi:hypothetical protein